MKRENLRLSIVGVGSMKIIARPGYEWITEKNYTKNAYRHTSCDHELRKGEIWLGNTYGNNQWKKGVEIPERYKKLKTIRLGEQAYDIDGHPISRDYCRPLIIHKSEIQEFRRIEESEEHKMF